MMAGLWNLPHHGVKHLKKGKVRIAFDCSANFVEHG